MQLFCKITPEFVKNETPTPSRGLITADIAVFHRLNDNEDKWIAAPENFDFTRDEIMQKIEFQEMFFDGELYV